MGDDIDNVADMDYKTNPTFMVLVSNIQCPHRRYDNLCQHNKWGVGYDGKHCKADICPIIYEDIGEP